METLAWWATILRFQFWLKVGKNLKRSQFNWNVIHLSHSLSLSLTVYNHGMWMHLKVFNIHTHTHTGINARLELECPLWCTPLASALAQALNCIINALSFTFTFTMTTTTMMTRIKWAWQHTTGTPDRDTNTYTIYICTAKLSQWRSCWLNEIIIFIWVSLSRGPNEIFNAN